MPRLPRELGPTIDDLSPKERKRLRKLWAPKPEKDPTPTPKDKKETSMAPKKDKTITKKAVAKKATTKSSKPRAKKPTPDPKVFEYEYVCQQCGTLFLADEQFFNRHHHGACSLTPSTTARITEFNNFRYDGRWSVTANNARIVLCSNKCREILRKVQKGT